MIGGPAGDNVDLIRLPQIVSVQVQVVQHHSAVLDARKYRISKGLWLLHDLLGHEVLVSALFRGGHLPVHMVFLFFHRLKIRVVKNPDTVSGENGDLAVLQIAHLPGILDDSGHIGGQKVEPLAVP